MDSFGPWLRANLIPAAFGALATALFLITGVLRFNVGVWESFLNGMLALVFFASFIAIQGRVRLWLK
jgi:hypothetical protein